MDGIEVIRARLGGLGAGPGVYRMLGEGGKVLYVGKAKNLKARVTQYTQTERMGSRIRKMVFETRDLVVVETRTETEALLLEANLIKSLKPKYNIIFRDDASYVSVVITDEETPVIRSHRGARKLKGEYFGPYPSAGAVYATLDLMERAFRLRSCADSVFKNRTRPCLKYDIKRCSGPCVGKITREDYAKLVEEARRFMRGERQVILGELQAQMEEYSAQMAFEQAAAVRDRIRAISAVSSASTAMTHALGDADVFAIIGTGNQEPGTREEVHGVAGGAGALAVQAFYYRNGQHVGNQTFFIDGNVMRGEGPALPLGSSPGGDGEALASPASRKDGWADAAEIMRVFLAMHYMQRVAPPHVFCNVMPAEGEVLADALGVGAGRKIRIEVPARGERREVMQQAEKNARSALGRKTAEADNWSAQMTEFGALLGLGRSVEGVECYDISNISGKFPVASCVVAGPEGMLRNRYRKYNVKTKDTPDDYAMMAEVLARRAERGIKEAAWPDVMLVDGGKGQLNVLIRVMADAGVLDLPECPKLVGIAKGEERDKGLETLFVHEKDGTLRQLPIAHGSGLIFVLQRVRDEAHRFAITFHRAKRGKAISVSSLDGVPGIGGGKKKALLLHFGSVEAVRNASVEELARAPGVGKALAQAIYDYFRG